MEWRLIELEENDAFTNMAIDEAILDSICKNKSDPTIRFYKWNPSAISLGYRQLIDDIDRIKCKKFNIDIVRRITGGRAVYHHTSDLTYSIILREELLPENIRGKITASHEIFCNYIINALNDMGISGAIYNVNDIMVDNKKISGSVQNPIPLHGRTAILQHGTLLVDYREDIMNALIKNSSGKTISVRDLVNLSNSRIYSIFKNAFLKDKEYYRGKLSREEVDKARYLAENKYKKEWWLIEQGSVIKGSCYG